MLECLNQVCGSVFISSGSGSSILGWTPIRIRIQSGSRALMTKNWKKIFSWEFFSFLSKTAIYLSLGLHKVCPSYRRSLQLSKEAIQHFKTWTFTNFCLLLWVIFSLLDPDPQTRLNPDPQPWFESGSNPDPKPCLYLIIMMCSCCSVPLTGSRRCWEATACGSWRRTLLWLSSLSGYRTRRTQTPTPSPSLRRKERLAKNEWGWELWLVNPYFSPVLRILDPGSAMGKNSGSGSGRNNRDHISESLETILLG